MPPKVPKHLAKMQQMSACCDNSTYHSRRTPSLKYKYSTFGGSKTI